MHSLCSLCMQGEQCNVVPDTIDDIVADIGQEEKDEGTVICTHTHTHKSLFIGLQWKALIKAQWIHLKQLRVFHHFKPVITWYCVPRCSLNSTILINSVFVYKTFVLTIGTERIMRGLWGHSRTHTSLIAHNVGANKASDRLWTHSLNTRLTGLCLHLGRRWVPQHCRAEQLCLEQNASCSMMHHISFILDQLYCM